MRYPRNMQGYGPNPPDAQWPGGANVAVQFVLNYEEGGENNVLHGDAASEAFLVDVVGAAPWPGKRHWNVESMYEYGARAGFWRLHRLFTSLGLPVTVYGVATALARAPMQVKAMLDRYWRLFGSRQDLAVMKIWLGTEVDGAEGDGHLERLRLYDTGTGKVEEVPAGFLFVSMLIG